ERIWNATKSVFDAANARTRTTIKHRS
ncbi:5,10-methylenetetrahydrofolate reductase, partial [Lactobacillus delbrueckii subsp. bulgaricus]